MCGVFFKPVNLSTSFTMLFGPPFWQLHIFLGGKFPFLYFFLLCLLRNASEPQKPDNLVSAFFEAI